MQMNSSPPGSRPSASCNGQDDVTLKVSSCSHNFKKFPTISVVVPAYNVERYIEEALDSLLAQSVPFHEIIVINDGSTDGTADRLARYVGHPLVQVHTTANQGLGRARNTGIAHATGEYLYFFDSDDILDPSFVATIGHILSTNRSLDLVFFSGVSFYDDGYEAGFDELLERKLSGDFPTGLAAAEALYGAGGAFANAVLYVSRTALWQRGLSFAPILYEDAEVFPRLCAAAAQSHVTNACLFRRRLRRNSIVTTRPTQAHVSGHWDAFDTAAHVTASLQGSPMQPFMTTWTVEMMWRYLKSCSDARIAPNLIQVSAVFRRMGYLPWRLLRDLWSPVNRVTLLRIVKWNTIYAARRITGRNAAATASAPAPTPAGKPHEQPHVESVAQDERRTAP